MIVFKSDVEAEFTEISDVSIVGGWSGSIVSLSVDVKVSCSKLPFNTVSSKLIRSNRAILSSS
jgi:hypothetical protein